MNILLRNGLKGQTELCKSKFCGDPTFQNDEWNNCYESSAIYIPQIR